jgi:DNA invertase Pin-like site-specific DNA recombinase
MGKRACHEEKQVHRRAIASAIKQYALGTRAEEICCKMGIPDTTFYNWLRKYAGQSRLTIGISNYDLYGYWVRVNSVEL